MFSGKDKIIKKREGLAWQQMQGESLILNTEKHEAHELNETASYIWSRIDGQTQLKDIIMDLSQDYEADVTSIESDVLTLTQELIDKDLVDCL